MIKKGWLVVHQRDKQEKDKRVRWRLRDLNKHPLDPGWERGEYRKCHKKFRKNASKGDIVFDVVYPNGAVGKVPRIIRSAFIVSRKEKNSMLKFESFYFLDGKWRSGIRVKIRRDHKKLNPREIENLFDSILESHSYKKYKTGEKPKSIDERHWRKMSEKAGEKIKEENFCRGCR